MSERFENVSPPSVEYQRNWAWPLPPLTRSTWVTRATTAPGPNPAVPSSSTTRQPDHRSRLGCDHLSMATPWSRNRIPSRVETRRQEVPVGKG